MANPKPKTIFIVAGEVSGDLHAAHLVRAIKAELPDVIFHGLGGEAMAREGVTLMHDLTREAVLGLGDVLRKYFLFRRIFRQTLKEIDRLKPDAVILTDYPGFNLKLAKAINNRFPVIYFVSPQLWAWAKGRVHLIKRTVKHMIAFFDFEETLYKEAGVPVTWVGHPLVDLVEPLAPKEALRREWFASEPPEHVISLLPGSRTSEVTRILPEMLKAAAILTKQFPRAQFLISETETVESALYEQILRSHGSQLSIKRISNRSYDVLEASDAALVSSGTATLDATLLTIPFVILYKTAWSTFFLGRRLVQIPFIGLVNVIAGRKIVPEFLQHEINPEKIAHEIAWLIERKDLREKMKSELSQIREKLGPGGAIERAANAVLKVLDTPVSVRS